MCLDEGKKTCRGSGNQRIYVYRHCIQEIFSFLLLTSCLWEHAPFSLSALIRLLTVDNTETNSAGCTLILSTSTNARKFTHAHSHRLNCRDEILSFTEMFRFQNTLCGWVTFFFTETPAIMCPYTSLLILICHIHIQAEHCKYKGMHIYTYTFKSMPLL